MKILKIKLGLFSLLAVLAVSVFLTSCEQQETLTDISTENLLTVVENSEYILPYGYDELSAEAKDEYLNSLDEEGFAKLIESAKVMDYFLHLGKGDLLRNDANHGDVFNQSTLELHLRTNEVEAFTSTDFTSNVESRGCGEWFNVGGPEWRCTYYYYGSCRRYNCTQRQKKICNWWPDKYRLLYATGC